MTTEANKADLVVVSVPFFQTQQSKVGYVADKVLAEITGNDHLGGSGDARNVLVNHNRPTQQGARRSACNILLEDRPVLVVHQFANCL